MLRMCWVRPSTLRSMPCWNLLRTALPTRPLADTHVSGCLGLFHSPFVKYRTAGLADSSACIGTLFSCTRRAMCRAAADAMNRRACGLVHTPAPDGRCIFLGLCVTCSRPTTRVCAGCVGRFYCSPACQVRSVAAGRLVVLDRCACTRVQSCLPPCWCSAWITQSTRGCANGGSRKSPCRLALSSPKPRRSSCGASLCGRSTRLCWRSVWQQVQPSMLQFASSMHSESWTSRHCCPPCCGRRACRKI